MALAFTLKGDLKPELLARAFAHAWENADLARFRFDLRSGQQWRADEVATVPFEITAAPDAEVKKLFIRDFETAFDLVREAPLRLRLIETKPGKAVLGIVAHHVALDGWSLARLLEKVTDAYNALVRGEKPPALPWEPYWDFLGAYEARRQLPGAAESVQFWRKENFVARPLLETVGPETRGHRAIYILNKKYYQKVRELAKAHRTTPFLFLLVCFARALARVRGRQDFLFSIPIAARDGDREEFTIGNCVNLVPMSVELDPAGDLIADLRAVRERYLDRLAHAGTPIQEIQASHAKDLTQLHFNFEPSVEEPKLDSLELDFYPFPVTQVERPLILNVNDTKKTYYVELDYQFQALDFTSALRVFTEAERVINQIGARTPAAPA